MENKKNNIVIFSSGDQRQTITKLSEKLECNMCKCTLWTNLFTRKNNNVKYALLPTLLKKIPTFDFAIILATPDDAVYRARNGFVENFHSMRDNVIFEIGLCVMALGTNRTIILQDENVRLFDDLIGVSGIHNDASLLSASALGVKCLVYSSVIQLPNLCDNIIEYIKSESHTFSPVIIGAACSTAVAYFNMFVKRIITCIQNVEQNDKTLKILVPLYIGHDIFSDISHYYKDCGFEKMTKVMDSGRDISFYYKIEDDNFLVCDIPTSIGASYQTARDILSIDAADIADVDSETRFLMKEADMFYLTLRKLLSSDFISNTNNVNIVLDRMVYNL